MLAHVRDLGFAPATVIDVGVASGTPDLYVAFPGARLLLVEPMAEWRETLEPVAAQRGGRLVIAAAGAEPGPRELAVHRVPACPRARRWPASAPRSPTSWAGFTASGGCPTTSTAATCGRSTARSRRSAFAFVRADGRFRTDHRYATSEQADRLYRSWDL